MTSDILAALEVDFDREDQNRLEFTRRAFQALPRMHQPQILDVGCGTGLPALELARLSDGIVTGLDVNEASLRTLTRRARERGLDDRIRTIRSSIEEMSSLAARFDIVWSEGVIYHVGIERGLREYRRMLRPEGFLVLHESAWLRPDPPAETVAYWGPRYPGIRTVSDWLDTISRLELEPVEHFPVPAEVWWNDYFGPLEEKVSRLEETHRGDEAANRLLTPRRKEVERFKADSEWFGAVFFIARSPDTTPMDESDTD